MEYDVTYIEIKTLLNDIVYAYGDSPDDFRYKCILLKSKVDAVIENVFISRYLNDYLDNGIRIISPNNIRYVKCDICGKIKPTSLMWSYGGIENENSGLCRDCDEKVQKGVILYESKKNYGINRSMYDDSVLD